MAALKRKFTVPSVEDLDEKSEVSKPKSLFNMYKNSTESVQEITYDSSMRNTDSCVNDKKTENSLTRKILPKEPQSSEKDLKQRIVKDNCISNQDPSIKEGLRLTEKRLPSTSGSCSTIKPTAGKTFRETFAFLEDTSHYKETVAKIKEKEYGLNCRYPRLLICTSLNMNGLFCFHMPRATKCLRIYK